MLSTGGLLDHVIASHPASGDARARAAGRGVSVYQHLEEVLDTLAGGAGVQAVTRLRWGSSLFSHVFEILKEVYATVAAARCMCGLTTTVTGPPWPTPA